VYDIAMTVSACLQSGTRADVAWLLESEGLPMTDPSAAVVFTPGGGKIGVLAGGALDGKLSDLAGRASVGRLVELEISEVDALIASLPSAGSARCLLMPADTMPPEVWELARARQRFCVTVDLIGDDVQSVDVYSDVNIGDADQVIRDMFQDGVARSDMFDGRAVSVFAAVARIVVVGSGPVAEAVADLAGFVGWDVKVAVDASTASGFIAPLSPRDMVLVAAHDLELAGAALLSALGSACGYVGSVGSRKMQSDRADWLAYRGATDLSRVHGPAGLDIGADTPEEVAVAVIAEAISSRP
jgi:xanthine dehydrogenase accessory factor